MWFHGIEAAFKSQLLLLARPLWFCIPIVYMSSYLQLAELLCNLSVLKYIIQLSFIMGQVTYTLAVPYNKIFSILLACDFKELQIICKPRHMKCFQTNFQIATFSAPTIDVSLLDREIEMFLYLVQLGQISDIMFTCRKKILFYIGFLSLTFSS